MQYVPGKVVTEATLKADIESIWDSVRFYENVSLKPSLIIRALLPKPRQITGSYRKAGDISRCTYSDGGFLTRRILKLVEEQRLDFVIIEQTMRFHRSVRLLGGSIEVEGVGHGRCVVRLVTRYKTNLKPLWMFSGVIRRVIRAMHDVVVEEMRITLEGRGTGLPRADSRQPGSSLL